MAQEFKGAVEEEGLSGTGFIFDVGSLVLSFVRSIPRAADDLATNPQGYSQFPVEILADGSGDCKGRSVLYASLMEALGYNVVLLRLDRQGYVGDLLVGLLGPYSGNHYLHRDSPYFYCETTASDLDIGQMPPAYAPEYYDGCSVTAIPC